MIYARRKAVAIAATGAVAAMVFAGMPASADGRERTDGLEAAATTSILPDRLNSAVTGTYIVELKSGAAVDAAASAKGAARSAALKAQQPIVDQAKSMGATIGQRYADVVNGFAFTGTGRVASALARNSAVAQVSRIASYAPDNSVAAVQVGAASAWENTGFTGKGVKVAIIDSGIDYYHANFGGAGLDAYNADNPTVIEPGSFPTAKVVGGYDFVGDGYDARDAAKVAVADPDPRDCSVYNNAAATAGGHGSHVAGSVAGYGVNTDGTTYRGPLTAAAIAGLKIGPGMAPEASLLAYRVFGCNGSVGDDIIVAAINRAVADGAGVINMSLGSSFGRSSGTEQTAIANAVKAGVVVVASAGNSGPSPYVTGAPASAPAALSVAALNKNTSPANVDIIPSSGTKVTSAPGGTGAVPADGLTVYSANLASSTNKLGCSNATLQDSNGKSLVTGKIVAIQRGTCTFVTKEAVAYANGAAAVILINNAAGTISPAWNGLLPVLVVTGSTTSALSASLNAVYAMRGKTATFSGYNFGLVASFSSGGPRYGDAGFKPDIAATGVAVRSTAVGTGTGYADFSGTSMAAPVTAGSVALVRQAHPNWTAVQTKAAVVNTASRNASLLVQNTRLTGNGIVQPKAAIENGVLIYPGTATKDGDTSLAFGVREDASVTTSRDLTIANTTGSSQTITLSSSFEGSPAGASMTFSKSSVTLAAGAATNVTATISLSADFMKVRGGASTDVNSLYGQVIGTRDDGKTATVPFSAVALARSAVSVKTSGNTVNLSNPSAVAGSADNYEWLMAGGKTAGVATDLKSLGAQYYNESALGLTGGTNKFVIFNLSTWNQIYNPADTQWFIDIDTTGDGVADFELFMFDTGYMTGGSDHGTVGTYLYYVDSTTGQWASSSKSGAYTLTRNVNTSIFQVGVKTSALCGASSCTASQSQSFRITAVGAQGWDDSYDEMGTISGTVKPTNPIRSSGDWVDVAAGGTGSFTVSTRALASGEKKTLGWSVVSSGNRFGLQSNEFYGF